MFAHALTSKPCSQATNIDYMWLWGLFMRMPEGNEAVVFCWLYMESYAVVSFERCF